MKTISGRRASMFLPMYRTARTRACRVETRLDTFNFRNIFDPSVENSLDAARMSACATSTVEIFVPRMPLENLQSRFVQSSLVPGCGVSLHVAYRAHTWDRRHHGRMRNREPKGDLRQRAIHPRQVPLEGRHVFHHLLLPVAAK